LSKNGTLPWYIQEMMEKLTIAFKESVKWNFVFSCWFRTLHCRCTHAFTQW
jgi:hypothetical protein